MKETMAGNELEARATLCPDEKGSLRHPDATRQELQPVGTQ